jgi:hypothetical protein
LKFKRLLRDYILGAGKAFKIAKDNNLKYRIRILKKDLGG